MPGIDTPIKRRDIRVFLMPVLRGIVERKEKWLALRPK